jgi:putative endonuclease
MRKPKLYYVYILASISGTLYIGITSELEERVFKHKEGLYDDFTKRYGVNRLVYFESFDDVRKAIDREKQLKGWRRAKKIALIESVNPQWKDLAAEWYGALKKRG